MHFDLTGLNATIAAAGKVLGMQISALIILDFGNGNDLRMGTGER
jgi:hypothetical protein